MLGLFAAVDLAQVVRVLGGGLLFTLHLVQAVSLEKGDLGIAGQ